MHGPFMNILMLGWEFPPYFAGGVGVVSAALARALVDEGCDVTYLMPFGPNEWVEPGLRLIVTSRHGTELRTGRIPSRLQSYVIQSPVASISATFVSGAGKPGDDALYGSELLWEIERFEDQVVELVAELEIAFDVIHAHDWTTVPAGLALSKVSGKPLVFHVHITEFDKSGEQGADPHIYAIEQRGMLEADRLIAVSRRIRDRCVGTYGAPPQNVRVVHNGVKPLAPPEGPLPRLGGKVILFLGRVTLQKGPDYFLEAAQRVLQVRPNDTFILAGSGDLWTPMIEKAAELGIGQSVLFPGFVDREAVAQLLSIADVFVMPSVSEPFGIVALEAQEAGVPVILSRQSGAGEVMDHALHADFWDVDDFAAKILAVLSHPVLATELKRSGAEEATSRTWSRAAQQVLSVYDDLVNQV